MNQRYDDQDFARHERDRDRERGQQDERGSRTASPSRESFYPGDAGSQDRNAFEQQRGEGSREYSQQYGQREPYNAGGSGGSTYGASGFGPYRGEGQPRVNRFPTGRYGNNPYGGAQYGNPYGRNDFGRARWGGPPDYGRGPGESRYSESQYGQRRFEQDRFSRDPRSADSGRGWVGYGGGSGPGDWPSSDYSRDRGGRDFGYGASGDQGYRHEPQMWEGPFSDHSEPQGYYGTGHTYGDGGVGFGGGYGEDRTSQATFGPDRPFWGGGYGDYSHLRGSPPAPRQGVFGRMFHRGPKGYQRSDERLCEDISERLMHAGSIDSSDVSVQVTAGKVTLEGTVPDRYMKHYIEDLVDACPGVQDIDNKVRVEASRRWSAERSLSEDASRSTYGTALSAGATGQSGATTQTSTGSSGATNISANVNGGKSKKD
jgi:hypothetical protein